MNTLADQYYIKALDLYPYNLEESIENLNYALSHNIEHAGANYLMGKLHKEQLNNLLKAEEYYIKSLACDPYNINACMDYILLLIILSEYQKAQKMISHTQKLKGIDQSKINSYEGMICEHKQQFTEALSHYNKALLEAYNDDYIEELNKNIKRVKMKRKILEKSNKSKSKEKSSIEYHI